MEAWERFLEKYRAFGQNPTRETHARLFADDATILHPGMAKPMPARQYVDFIVEALKHLPNFHLLPVRWAANGDTIFVEARNTATVDGSPIEWPAVYVITLRDEMVIRGRPYYDRSEALMHFQPVLAAERENAHIKVLRDVVPHSSSTSESEAYVAEVYEKVVRPYAANGKNPDPAKFQQFYAADGRMVNPGFERPLRRDELTGYYTALKSTIRNLQLHLERWAVAPGLLFIEWTVTGEISGKPLVLPNADRFSLGPGMLVTEGVAYFDNLGVRALTDESLRRFANVSLGNVASTIGAAH